MTRPTAMREFVVKESKCSFDPNTGILTFVVKNEGNYASTGWTHPDINDPDYGIYHDYRPIIEVTSDLSQSKEIGEAPIPAGYALYQKNGVTYYPKSLNTVIDSVIDQTYRAESETMYTISKYDDVTNNYDFYMRNTPLHKPGDEIEFRVQTKNLNPGSSYLVCADAVDAILTGDTIENIDDSHTPIEDRNNYFLFTVPVPFNMGNVMNVINQENASRRFGMVFNNTTYYKPGSTSNGHGTVVNNGAVRRKT
jgi:hypothetical protein